MHYCVYINTPTDFVLVHIKRIQTLIYCLNTYLNTIYFQLWRIQLKLQNVKTAKNLSSAPTCCGSPMEPSSGSSLYLAKKLPLWLHIVVLCSRGSYYVQCSGRTWRSNILCFYYFSISSRFLTRFLILMFSN
jgi:hypothetical protein